MNIRMLCGAVLMSGLAIAAVPASQSLAQSNDMGVSAPKDTGASAPKTVAPKTTVPPRKHRYWRHRGGKHPHFGSRRLRS